MGSPVVCISSRHRSCKAGIKTNNKKRLVGLGACMLERLVYRSKATHKLGNLQFNLRLQCRKRNRDLGITEHLLYTEELFVQ